MRPPWRPASHIPDLKEPTVGPREASEFVFRTGGSLRSPQGLPWLWGEVWVYWQRVGCCFCGSHPNSVLSYSLCTPSSFFLPTSSGLLLRFVLAHTCGFFITSFSAPIFCVLCPLLCVHVSSSLFHSQALCVCLPSLLGAIWYLSCLTYLT